MAIDRCFTLQGAGTIVTGAVRSGSIDVGDKVLVLPLGEQVRVRTLHAQGRECATGHAGERCALNLVGIDKNSLRRGDWLVNPELTATTSRYDAELRLLKMEPRAIRTWSPVQLHVGTTCVAARVAMLEDDSLRPGDKSLVQIVTERALPLVFGDLFIIRDVSVGRSIGGGHVVDPRAPRRRRRTAERQSILTALHLPQPDEALEALLLLSPGIVNLNDFVADRGLSDSETGEILQVLEPKVFEVDRRTYVSRTEAIDAIGEAISQKITEFHDLHPDLPGMPRTELLRVLEPRLNKTIFDAAIAILVKEEVLVAGADVVRLPSQTSSVLAADQVLCKRVSDVMEARRHQPPPLRELAETLNQPIRNVRKICKTMVRMGVLVEVTTDRFFLKAALISLARLAHEIAKESRGNRFTVAAFRDRAGCGRAVAVQVLEYFDRRGITGRRENVRIVSKHPIDVFGMHR